MVSLRGKTEFDIFKNFYKEKGDYFRDVIANMELSSKDDVNSSLFSLGSEKHFKEKRYYSCLEKFTESLLHATYNSQAYAIALLNRAIIYFTTQNFENCAIDLSLCLQADFPMTKKPRLYIIKAKCYSKMGNLKNMLETIDDCYNFMKNCSEISKELMTYYLISIKSVMELNDLNFEGTQPFHPLLETAEIKEPHALNSNVSSSIKFRFTNTSDTDFIAARDIPCGEVLFLEQAYSFGSCTSDTKVLGIFFCDYCLVEAKNCIPCRTCVALVYCSENCRIKAWNDCHQWECDIIRANFLPNGMILSLRTVIKAACSGAIKQIASKKSIKPGKNADPYLNMYSVFVDLVNLRLEHNKTLLLCCKNAVLMVEFLKKSNFISYVISKALYNLSFDELVDLIGGMLLKHNIQALQRSITVNRASPVIVLVDEFKPKLQLCCVRVTKFNAFCPLVSGVPYSCLPNTNIDFQGYTAVVKASKDIKAGERIYRSTQNLSPKTLYLARKRILDSLMISCKCESCLDITKNCDIYNTFICTSCGGNAVLEDLMRPSVVCLDCNIKSTASMISEQLVKYNLARVSGDLSQKLNCVKYLKSIANPHHRYIYEMYRDILQLRSLKGDAKKFKKALDDFKNCSKTKNKYGDPYYYLSDVIVICEAFYKFLHINKVKLKEEKKLELLNIFSELIEEAKEISVVTFPPMVQLFNQIQLYLLKFRIDHIYLKAE